ncbi:MAG: amidohydrolase family protein [Pseudomonadota bacterium]
MARALGATTGRSVGGTELHGARHRLSREEALFHYTVGAAWFSQEETRKGRIAPGQFVDIAVLNAPYFDVADDELMDMSSELTITAGRIVHGAGDFVAFDPDPLPPIRPDWSAVRTFGGYQT